MLAISAHGCADELQCNGGQIEVNGVCECPPGSSYRRPERVCEKSDTPARDASTDTPDPTATVDGGKDAAVADAARGDANAAPRDAAPPATSTPDAAPSDAAAPDAAPPDTAKDAATDKPDAQTPPVCDGGTSNVPGCPAPVPAKPITVRLEPSADSYVNATGANFGPHDILSVDPQDGPQRTFLRFDLKSIPTGAQISRATLQLTAYEGYAYGGDGNCYVHLVTNDRWVESEINGMNQPSAEPDALGYWWLWYDATPKDMQGVLSGEPLRATVEQEVRGDRALSLRIHSPGYKTHYRSRENSNPAQRPNLTVEYLAP